MKHLIVIPYYCEEEVKRYEKIAAYLLESNGPRKDIEFLLSSAPSIEPSRNLENAFLRIAPVRNYICKTRVEGYPARPCAMFWETMDFVRANYDQDGGFVLWFESDMIPIRKNWIERLESEWFSRPDLVLMGIFIKESKYPKMTVARHINGGACYAKNYADFVPLKGRVPLFDVEMFPYIEGTTRFKVTKQIAFTSLPILRRHVHDSQKVILHGFRQDKNEFLSRAMEYVRARDQGIKIQTLLNVMLAVWVRCCPRALWSWKIFSRTCPIHT
ncbi:MAG: hypothetical protein HYZ84_00040 [Candidatus Omnitrophica bacterium]|nr:hypothetical protein [Candidatus Omnitrophota bacterium]